MSPRLSLVLNVALSVLWLLLTLPQSANAHVGSHGAAGNAITEQSASLPGDDSGTKSAIAEQSVSRSHCPQGNGSACCCSAPSAAPQRQADPAAPVAALLFHLRATLARLQERTTYLSVPAATVLIHLSGPRAPPFSS